MDVCARAPVCSAYVSDFVSLHRCLPLACDPPRSRLSVTCARVFTHAPTHAGRKSYPERKVTKVKKNGSNSRDVERGPAGVSSSGDTNRETER